MTAVIRVDGVGKRYDLGRALDPHRTLREALVDGAARAARGADRLLRRDGRRSRGNDAFWALRDVSFEVARGEAVGLIGGNGAGKSTLLKLLSRITAPTTGRIELRGRVGSLLEVGTGFHPDLTGRENVFLNGAILGMRRAEVARKFDEIVAFAEVERFIDTPVKRYSSGMYLRLAFAVAAHLEPELLLVDEVLAVGDAAFQKKCLGKMGDVAAEGRTVLFVSHNMEAVQRLCGRTLLMAHGRLAADGGSQEVTERYLLRTLRGSRPGECIALADAERDGSGEARFVEVRYHDPGQPSAPLVPGGPLSFELCIEASRPLVAGSVAVVLHDGRGTKLVNADTVSLGQLVPLEAGLNRLRLDIEAVHLNPGSYVVGLWLAAGPVSEPMDFVERAFELVVIPEAAPSLGMTSRADGLVSCRFGVVRLA